MHTHKLFLLDILLHALKKDLCKINKKLPATGVPNAVAMPMKLRRRPKASPTTARPIRSTVTMETSVA